MGDVASTALGGQEWRGYRRGVAGTDDVDQYVIPVEDKIVSYKGRANSFRIPGNAAVTHTLSTLHNATGSTILVNVNRVKVDMMSTVVKATLLVQVPVVRIYKITVLPTAGTDITKVPLDGTLSSSSSVTIKQGASAHRTASAITATIPANQVLDQLNAPRVLTAVGFELIDTHRFFEGEPDVRLGALEGLAVVAEDAVVTTGNPATDWWNVTWDWTEYTRP